LIGKHFVYFFAILHSAQAIRKGTFKEIKMNKPTFTFNLVEKFEPKTYQSTFLIVNFEGEVFNSFAEEESEKAFGVWMSYLSEQEKTQWNDYLVKCESEDDVAFEQQCERTHFSYN
jgi:hypothetical protein